MSNGSLGKRRDFRSLFDELDGVALWTASEPGKFEYISAGFEDIWGVPPEEIKDDIGKLIESIHPDDRDRVRANIEESTRELRDTEYEGRVVRPDGSVRWTLNRQVILQDEAGNVSEIIGISTDITDQKRREQELELLNRIVRHDIRNDMAVVLGWAEMLDDHVDDEGREYLQKILASGEHVVELTEVAREYVETVVSDEALTVEPVPLHSVLETELSLREESFPEAEFVLGNSPSDVEVAANSMLSSVFRNLLNNAVQHNDADTPHIEVSYEARDDDVEVRIADNGPGIADDHKDTVFGKGERGLGSPGTGIGLYLVDTLVTEYGGEIWVEDNEPTGAVFVIELPRAG
ncbi:PAS domain-containing sensor histidine kinase [Halorubrum persicum]|uniref:histidine kinase n=1 Tax=Halorubrum persicum TaxID=1383844 RepID=A0A2G1WKL9_9EURY|nr:PAS domain-containing sensor histidine kinase [Halorubrum persicum]PHQ39389.1 PAS domain-containing sensor histidine kinase [Halorubrum persicum]